MQTVSNPSPKPELPPSNDPTSEVTVILQDLGQHGLWWWKVLRRANALSFLVPWPLPYLAWLVNKSAFQSPRRWYTYSSGWMTLSLAVTLAIHHSRYTALILRKEAIYPILAFLVLGAFSVFGVLAISVASPSQTIIGKTLTQNPNSTIGYIAPYMWSFMWSTLTYFILLFHPLLVLDGKALSAVVLLVCYSVAMVIHTAGHTMRLYLIGLIVTYSTPASRK